MNKTANSGSVPYLPGTWRRRKDEQPPSGSEFERFGERVEAFIDGFFQANGIVEPPFYAQGDFLGERSEQIHMKERNEFTQEFVDALHQWMKKPRNANWRLLVQETWDAEVPTVIYPDCILRPNNGLSYHE